MLKRDGVESPGAPKSGGAPWEIGVSRYFRINIYIYIYPIYVSYIT
jgi:hypothetical protein